MTRRGDVQRLGSRGSVIWLVALCGVAACNDPEATDDPLQTAGVALASETAVTAPVSTTAPPACIVGTSSLTIAQRDSLMGGIAADSFSVDSGSVVTGGANINNVAGATVRISGATLYGTFHIAGAAPSAANGELINGGRIVDTIVTNAGVQAVLPTHAVTAGTTPVNVNSGDRPRTIAPGAYAGVNVNGSTVTFSAGTYRLASLTINSGSTTILDVSGGPITFDVAGAITFNGGTLSTTDPSKVSFYSASSASTAITVNTGVTTFPGTVTAPNGGISIGSRIALKGCIGAKTVNIQPDTTAGVAVTLAPPTFTPPAGMYPTTQSVSLTCAASGTDVYYTTDGTPPTPLSTKYTAPVSVSATTTIRAICSASVATSAEASSKYTIGVDLRPEINNRGIPIRDQLTTDYCVLFSMTFLQEYLWAGALGTGFNHISVDYAIQAGNVASSSSGDSSDFRKFSMGYNNYGAVLDSVWPFTGAQYNFATWNATFTPLVPTGLPMLNPGSRLAGKCLRESDDGLLTNSDIEQAIGYLIRGIPVAIAFDGHAVGLVGFERNATDAGGGHFIYKDSYVANGYQNWTFDFLKQSHAPGVALYAYEWAPTFPVAYEGTAYGGYNYALAKGSYILRNLMDMGAANDAIKSIKVPAGYTVRLYQDDNFGEPHVDLTRDVSDLASLGFAGVASSIVIF